MSAPCRLIRDAIFDSAKHAGLSPVKEVHAVANSLTRPGDIFLQNWQGKHTSFDVAITLPLSKTSLPQSHKSAGAALLSMKSNKNHKHFRACQLNGVAFVPLVVKTLGGWDQDAIFHLRAIAKQASTRSLSESETVCRQLFQRLSVLLKHANAGLIASRAPPPPSPHIIGV